jgi:hypothetical protein
MHEHIGTAAIGLDESVSACGVEKFDRAVKLGLGECRNTTD